MTCSLLPLPAMAVGSDNTFEPEIAVEEVIYDISKGSVIAGADSITGVTEDGTSTTTPWADMAGHDFVVTGTAVAASGYHIEVAADCPQNVELTLRGVSITTQTASDYSAVCNKSLDKELTLNLEGANTLTANTWRLLWNEGGVIRFVGQGENPSLDLVVMQDKISLMRSVNGTFAFESCAVTMNRAVGADNLVASDNTTVEISHGATITDSTGIIFSEADVGDIVHDLSTATADVEIGKSEIYRKDYTYTGTDGVNKWTLVYPNVRPLHIVTGTAENANFRVTVTSPEADILLKDLTLNMNVTGSRSAFLVKYADPADYGKQLTVKVSGNVSLTAGTASTFNTNDVDNVDPAKRTQPEKVLVVGESSDGTDKLTITRTGDTSSLSPKAAVNVNLTAENLKVVVQKNCNFNVTAGTGSVVTVGGYIGGEVIEDGGQLLDPNFHYEFIADGHAFVPVADKSNDNVLTLLLPGSANLSDVTLTGTPGWTVDGYTTDADGNTSLDFTGNEPLNLTVRPSDEIITLGGTVQTIIVRAMKGSNIASLYLTIGEDSENTMVQVDADSDHDTTATGTATLLNDNTEGDTVTNLVMEIKGRGNASWTRAKKGYQVKLDKKKNVLDMGTSKKWVLLPSAVDHALIRNAVGFDLAEELGLDFTSKWRWVDFYIDGEYYGLYILCEKTEVGDNRIEITNLDSVLEGAIGKDNFLSEQTGVTYSDDYKTATVTTENGTDIIDLTGGYHLEFDNYIDPMQFAAGNIKQISVKEPECLGANPETDESFTYIRNFMAAADAAVLDTTSNDFMNYINIESFAKMWLLLEAIYAGDATDNMHIWKESDKTGDGKIHAGPAWDYDRIMARDLKFGSAVVAEAKKVRINESDANLPQQKDTADYNAYWIIRLMKHPEFKAEIKRQYELNKEELFTNCATCNCANATQISEMELCDTCGDCYVHAFTANQEDLIRNSLTLDLVRWYGYKFNNTNQVGDGSLTANSREVSIANMKQFACVRNGYLADRIAPWEANLFTVTFKDGEQVVATKQAGSSGVSSLPTAENGCETLMGWFYMEGESEVEFTTGTPVTKDMTVSAKWSDPVLTLNETKAATCVETGYFAHYLCPKCGKLFNDAAHENEITADSIIIPIDPNNHVHTEIRGAYDATEEEDGYTGDTYCLDCGALVSEGSYFTYSLIVYDISKGSVTAGAAGITGATEDGTSTTIPWVDMAGHDIVVTGTAGATSGYHIEVAADCAQNVELTLSGVSITTATTGNYSAVCNKSLDKELTLNLEGANTLTANTWRLLWNEGGVIRFVGRGENPTLNLAVMQANISLMRSVNGTFAFESCAVTMNRVVGADNQVASDSTTVEISNGATITDSNSITFSEAKAESIEHDLSTATADVEIGKSEIYRKDYTYTGTDGVNKWTLVYPNVRPLHIVTGTVENAKFRVTVTSPGANILLKDLILNMEGTGSRSAFLVKYADSADYGKQLTVKVSGDVSLTAGTASTFNTSDVDNTDPAKRTQPENVLVVGVSTDGTDKLTIIRTDDTSGVSAKAAVGVNLTAENLEVIVQKNCNFDVTAGMGAVVTVGGYIGGKAIEDGGQLIDSNFHYEFKADGHAFVPVADKSNDNVLTLLLPGSADLSDVTLAGTPGWTVDGYTTDADGNTSLDFTGNVTLNLTVTPPDEIIALGGTEQAITVRAMKSSDIPAVCLNLTEGTMSAVNGDPDHETTAKGKISLLNDKSGGTELLDIAGTEIKGRGNASWNRAKKSYQIKLDAKADVLGMGNSKKWILLPSAADLSMMRSAVGFELAQKLGMEFAANWEFVDFYVNGEYYGLFILCEKAEVGTNRIGITNPDDELEEAIGKDNILSEQTGVTYSDDHKTATVNGAPPIDLTGGYHLEFDNYDDPMQFGAGGIQRITVKEPECLGANPKIDESFTYIRNFMAAADAAVLDTTSNDFMNYIDIESFAQMWLLKQYMDDYDAVRNMHLWKESEFSGDGLIHAGPAWDFDNSMCRDTYDVTTAVNNAKNHTYFNENGNAQWLKKLEKHPAFQAEVVKQYEEHGNLFTSCDNCDPNACGNCYIHNFVALQAEKTDSASVMDTVRWYGTTFSNKPVSTENRTTSLQVVEAFACARNDYLKGRIEDWEVSYTITFDSNGGSAVDPITQDYGTTIDTAPVSTLIGYTLEGWYTEEALTNKVAFPYTITGNATLYAKWTIKGLLGDVNGDGEVKSTDALIVLSYAAGLEVPPFPENIGDVNGDGEVNSTDALIILSYAAGLEVSFPVGEAV